MNSKSKYYYDYTRNMNDEQMNMTPCGKPACINKEECKCLTGVCTSEGTKVVTYTEKNEIETPEGVKVKPPTKWDADKKNGIDAWIQVLEEEERQPTCNIENPEDCENCGS